MLLAKIHECLPSTCEKCGQPMRLLAFILEPTDPPAVLPSRAPPQSELDFNQVVEAKEWPGMDQTAGAADENRN